MKKFVVFVILTAFTGSLYAQNTNCRQTISIQQFNQKYQLIKNQPDDKSKLYLSKQLLRTFCFSSEQVKEIAFLYENDFERLEFAKVAYKNTIDKHNFYDVYDTFIYFSSVFRLHDFVSNKEVTGDNNGPEIQETPYYDFPEYNYPSYENYKGARNCSQVISETNFSYMVGVIYKATSDQEKYNKAKTLIENSCLSASNLMKIGSLFKSEDYKLKFAIAAQNSVYDLDNYIEMKQIFNSPSGRSKFIENFGKQGNQASVTGSICTVSNSEYNIVITTLKNEKFNTNKVNAAKNLIKSKRCYTAFQIKGIVDLFSYENSRLEIARYAYDYVINQSEYYTTISQAFTFESSKKNLLDYINSKTR